MAILFVGTANKAKLLSVQQGYTEYHPNDLYTIVLFSIDNTDPNTPILGNMIKFLQQPDEEQLANMTLFNSTTGPNGKKQQHHLIVGIGVESGVAAQPFSAEETLQGGRNRANAIKSIIQSTPLEKITSSLYSLTTTPTTTEDFYFIGIEGGIEKVADKWLESGYIIVVNNDGVECVGTSARFELANFVIDELNTGKELCQVLERLSDLTPDGQGYMGMITNQLLNRARAYNHGVLFAFSKFESPSQYWDECDHPRETTKN